jgi:multiple sugar transport system permease protein
MMRPSGFPLSGFSSTVALLLALLLDTKLAKLKSFFRLLYFLPYAVPGVFASIMWGFLYSKPLDPILQAVHFDPLSSGLLLYSIINIATWEWTGYNMTLYAASLSGISTELYEAAKLDGCNEWKLARYIKLPLLKPTLVMTIVLSFIGSMQLFNEPFLLNTLTPISQNFTPNIDIYNMAFSLNNLPYAATLSVILALITILVSIVVMICTRLVKGRTPALS